LRVVLQRVKSAQVDVSNETISKIGPGLLLLVGIGNDDEKEDARYLVEKCLNLRIFEDENNKMNISGLDVKAEILTISQFTLFADTRRGRRPSFTDAAPPVKSEPMFDSFVTMLQESGLLVKTGKFGAYMQVKLENDGPVTIILNSKDRKKRQSVNGDQ
jgi:D-tyrosyl-tRNA(Tyr) deacylase